MTYSWTIWQRGAIPAVDLRPALIAAKAEGKVYRMNDTHWTALGAVAAFNAIV